MLQPWMNPADLAPGDARSAAVDWTGFELHRIASTTDPMFPRAYEPLWDEFASHHEIEQPEVLARRMRWNPAHLVDGCALLYELFLVTKDGAFAAVRDHTAIVCPEFEMAVVHMSHILIDPAFRRTGLAGWLRSLPVATARACLAAQGFPDPHPIHLIAEMEPANPADEAKTVRLTAYGKAGYRKIDPSSIDYLQPDFRPPAEIDATGGPRPLPLSLLVRKVGRESESAIRAETVRRIVTCLYRMYETDFGPRNMECVWKNLELFPRGEQLIALLPPTAISSRESGKAGK